MDGLRDGTPAAPDRGAPLCSFKQTSRILAGFPDDRFGALAAGGAGGDATLAGLRLARERGWTAPRPGASAEGDGRG